jgi:hypothetical protein
VSLAASMVAAKNPRPDLLENSFRRRYIAAHISTTQAIRKIHPDTTNIPVIITNAAPIGPRQAAVIIDVMAIGMFFDQPTVFLILSQIR